MKNWEKPDMAEVSIADTQYGAGTVTLFDYIYVNQEGNWEGTFVEES